MADDVEPAFAAWRFPAGAPRRHCTIRFESRDIEAAEAEPSLLHAYLATRASRLFRHSPPEVSRGFGVLAKSIVERSRRRPAGYGGTGCLELVRFRMPPAEPAAAEE